MKAMRTLAIAVGFLTTVRGEAAISTSQKQAHCRGVAIATAAMKDIEADLRQMDFSKRNPKEENLDWGLKLKSAEPKTAFDPMWENTFVVRFVSGEAPVHPEANIEYEVITTWTATGCVAKDVKVTAEE